MENLKNIIKQAIETREASYNAVKAKSMIEECLLLGQTCQNFDPCYDISLDEAISRTLFNLKLDLADYYLPVYLLLKDNYSKMKSWIKR